MEYDVMPYTVILLYPEYITSEYGETVCHYATGWSACEAVETARKEVASCYEEIEDPSDLKLVSVFKGKHEDLRNE